MMGLLITELRSLTPLDKEAFDAYVRARTSPSARAHLTRAHHVLGL